MSRAAKPFIGAFVCERADPWLPTSEVLLGQPLGKVHRQLSVNNAPILPPAGPLFRNIHHCQIQHFKQTVIGRKHRFWLSYLPELTVEALNGVSGIDESPDLLRVLEIGAEIRPILTPGLRNLFYTFFTFGLTSIVTQHENFSFFSIAIDKLFNLCYNKTIMK